MPRARRQRAPKASPPHAASLLPNQFLAPSSNFHSISFKYAVPDLESAAQVYPEFRNTLLSNELIRSPEAVTYLTEAFGKLDFAINNSYAPQTERNYSGAVLRYIKFAAQCGVPEHLALPAPNWLVCCFAASGIGRTGPDNAKNNLSALAAWHNARNLTWSLPPQIRTIKRALRLHWPIEKQQKPPRPPVSPQMMRSLAREWAHGDSCQKCALAIATAAWTGQMRLGEVLPPTVKDMDPSRLPSRSAWSRSSRSENASCIQLPWTKTTGFRGAYVYLLHQLDPYDPSKAIIAHLLASILPTSALLCSFMEEGTCKTLDKTRFLKMCNEIWSKEGFSRITGHSFRIGGTTSLLRSGVNAEVVKKMGRWSSDAYLRYWRNLEEIFADQASSVAWIDFMI